MNLRYTKLLATSYCIFPLAVMIASYINHRAIVPLSMTVAIVVLFVIWKNRLWDDFALSVPLAVRWALLGVLSWLAISAFWAPDMVRSLISVGKLCGTSIVIILLLFGAHHLPPLIVKRTLITFALALAIIIGLWVLDVISGGIVSFSAFRYTWLSYYGFYWFKAAMTFSVLGCFLIAMLLWLKKWPFASILTICLAVSFAAAVSSRTLAMVAPSAMLLAFVLIILGQSRMKFLTLFMGLASVVFVICIGNFFSISGISLDIGGDNSAFLSGLYRAYIWEYVSLQIQEHPIIGWGLTASQSIGSNDTVVDPFLGRLGESIPSHPHNFSYKSGLKAESSGMA